MTTQEQEAVLTLCLLAAFADGGQSDHERTELKRIASTYALGQLAKQYYGGGRVLSTVQLRELFGRLTDQARSLHGRYEGQIEQQAGQTGAADLLPLIQKL